jgi:hypothetical protein
MNFVTFEMFLETLCTMADESEPIGKRDFDNRRIVFKLNELIRVIIPDSKEVSKDDVTQATTNTDR